MSSLSKETATRSAVPVHDALLEPNAASAGQSVRNPSEVVAPTRTDSIPQQGSTMPGDGSEVRQPNVVEVPAPKVPFKDQVIGYAKKTRGTVLGKSELKEHGDKILEGEVPARQGSLN